MMKIKTLHRGINSKGIGSRIREIRGERTQKVFGQSMGTTQSYISDLERGKSLPSVSFLVRLGEASGRSYNWILTGREELEAPTIPPLEEKMPPPPAVAEIDYTHIQGLINILRDADPPDKPRVLKMLVSYLLMFL